LGVELLDKLIKASLLLEAIGARGLSGRGCHLCLGSLKRHQRGASNGPEQTRQVKDSITSLGKPRGAADLSWKPVVSIRIGRGAGLALAILRCDGSLPGYAKPELCSWASSR
jgi:hypothetical protein